MRDVRDLLVDLTSGDESRAESAASMLAEQGSSIFPELATLLGSPDAERRWWAIRTLAEMTEPRSDWLRQGLGDLSAEVRAAAALALAAHPDGAAGHELVQLFSDEDSVVAVLAVRAVIAIGREVVPELLDAFRTAVPRGRIQIMRALAEMRDPRSISTMMAAAGEDSAVLNYWAHEGLEALGLNMVYLKPE